MDNHQGSVWQNETNTVNALWPCDAIWRHRTRSTLVQVMAASHYLKQCWLIVNEILWHSTQDISSKNELEWYNFKLTSSRTRWIKHVPLVRYLKLRVRHAPGMPGTFFPPPWVSDPDIHHGTCVTHVPWCMPRSLTSGFLWSRWRGQRSRHSRCMRKLPLQWRHNERDGVSNHQPWDCLLNRLFRRRSKKTSKLHVTGLCVGNSQRASNAENVSIWWRHHVILRICPMGDSDHWHTCDKARWTWKYIFHMNCLNAPLILNWYAFHVNSPWNDTNVSKRCVHDFRVKYI